MNDVKERFKVSISYAQAWRGKAYALELLKGSPEESFSHLPIYCYNLKKANPGTVTHIAVDEIGRFEMLFVAIGAAIRSFMQFLWPLIVIDGAHLKGKFLGIMFLAIGMDENNQILPIAYSVGKTDSGESWKWFLSKLKDCIGDNPNLIIISDRAASIDMAIRTVFPYAYHGLCCRHLMVNLRLKSMKGKNYESLWWQTCKAYRVSDFEERFYRLTTVLSRVQNTLVNIGFEKWARAHCSGSRYNIMTSNSAESINALSRHARKLLIIGLVEFFREYLQKWYFNSRQVGGDLQHSLTKWVENKITRKIAKSVTWTVTGIDDHTFEVADGGKKDCSHWALNWFSKDIYKATYEELINPLPAQFEWEIPPDFVVVQPPLMNKRQAGRPRENRRIPSRGEEVKQVVCTRCCTQGHNRDQCRAPLPSQVLSKSRADGSNNPYQPTAYVNAEDFREYVFDATSQPSQLWNFDLNEA